MVEVPVGDLEAVGDAAAVGRVAGREGGSLDRLLEHGESGAVSPGTGLPAPSITRPPVPIAQPVWAASSSSSPRRSVTTSEMSLRGPSQKHVIRCVREKGCSSLL